MTSTGRDPAGDPPIACTLEPGDVPQRVTQWRALLQRARTWTTGPDGTVRIELATGIDIAQLARLVEAEQSCCSFFSFAITVDRRGPGLEVSAPEGAADMVASLFGPPT